MTPEFRCQRKDCFYRAREFDCNCIMAHGCNYMAITGKSRIAQLPPEQRDPAKCPLYLSQKEGKKAVKKSRYISGPEWEKLAMAMYKEGKNDVQIGKACGVSQRVIFSFRKKRGLPPVPRPKPPEKQKYEPEKRSFDEAKVMRLYREGKNDREISEAVTVSRTTIRRWRKRRGLKANVGLASEGDFTGAYDWARAMVLYEKGYTDRQIAEALGCAFQTVNSWRRRNNLPSKYLMKKENKHE